MCEELLRMINNNGLSVKSYFTMAPYLISEGTQYRKIIDDVDYFEEFNVVTNKTFEHLSKLARVSFDNSVKLLVITGYSGSGKTNFLRLCEAIIENKYQLKEYNEMQDEIEHLYRYNSYGLAKYGIINNEPDFFDENKKEKRQNEIATIRKQYNDSINAIRKELSDIWYNNNMQETRKNIARYLNNQLNGTVVFFDFDAGKQDSKTPLELKLTRQIERHIKRVPFVVIELFYNFYECNKADITDSFENRYQYYVDKMIKTIYDNHKKSFDEAKNYFIQAAKVLAIDQLLFVEILLTMAENVYKNKINRDRVYYIFDNLDMISGPDNQTFLNTIGDFWNFISEMQSLMHTLSIKNEHWMENEKWIDCYSKFKYIFAMRETTSMHIGDHLRTRVIDFSKHVDVSFGVNKSFIVKKRYDMLKKYVDSGRIKNQAFIETAKCIEQITEDKYYKWNLFSLFNNDYRKAFDCLNEICSIPNSPILSSVLLLNQSEPYMKFGGRGIAIKIICDEYKRWGYFEDLKVPTKGNKYKSCSYNVTLIRLVLTVLINLQKEKSQADLQKENGDEIPFFVVREKSVSLRQLYEKILMFCDKTKPQEVFLDCIEMMFSAKTWNYWNHLITFDNVPEYSRKEFIEALQPGNQRDIYVRCTKAGEQYLNLLCVHYEFFACRYANRNNGLFSIENQRKNNGKFLFESQIDCVYKNVKNCCEELKKMNEMIMSENGFDTYEDMLDSCYVKGHQFHEERIIHNHISYLDAFRIYLVRKSLCEHVSEINKKLCLFIRQYIDLLQYEDNLFYSTNSEILYDELNECIKYIENNQYNDTSTIISRDFYKSVLSVKEIR